MMNRTPLDCDGVLGKQAYTGRHLRRVCKGNRTLKRNCSRCTN